LPAPERSDQKSIALPRRPRLAPGVDLLAMGGAKGALETKNLLEMCQ
jgi:hypothetical protein